MPTGLLFQPSPNNQKSLPFPITLKMGVYKLDMDQADSNMNIL